MSRWIILLISFSVIFNDSCNNAPKKLVQSDNKVNVHFDSFMKKFSQFDLPIKIKGCKIDCSKMLELNSSNDSPFVSDPEIAYCSIKTNGGYYAIITL